MDFWRDEGGRDGFVLFDDAAVLYPLRPALFRCVPVRADLKTSPPWFGIGRPTELLVRDAPQGGTVVTAAGFRAFPAPPRAA